MRGARAGLGGVARRSLRNVTDGEAAGASTAWRREIERERGRRDRAAEQGTPAPSPASERWVDEGIVGEAAKAVGRAAGKAGRGERVRVVPEADLSTRRRRKGSLPPEVVDELSAAVGRQRGERLAELILQARDAVERGHDIDARRLLSKVVAEAPGAPSARELYGVVLYRLGKYRAAIGELETFRQLSGNDLSQHPVLADSYRALHRYGEVEELWDELREGSPTPELVAEGRIVVAGSWADRGELAKAIQILEKSPKPSRRIAEHHLRTWYALADLYERSGDVPAARALFRKVLEQDPRFVDVGERLAALG